MHTSLIVIHGTFSKDNDEKYSRSKNIDYLCNYTHTCTQMVFHTVK